MRHWPFAILLSLSASSGCSLMIARCGKDLSVLETREEVRKDFGEPVASGVEDGQPYEEFRTRRKIVNEQEVYSLNMGLAMTGGLIEFIAFPLEVYEAMKATIAGQNLRFYYDGLGNVRYCQLNGQSVSLRRNRIDPDKPNTTKTADASP
jgi:hypothetical protein